MKQIITTIVILTTLSRVSAETNHELVRICLKSEDYTKCINEFKLNNNYGKPNRYNSQTNRPMKIKIRPYIK